jgi:pimeloyl-ACP methyl ester carboxylesterase
MAHGDPLRKTTPVIQQVGIMRDRVLPYSQAKEAFSRLPEGYLELIPECEHLPQVEQPERYISGLRRFLSEKGS